VSEPLARKSGADGCCRAARSTHGERQQVLQALLARGAAQLGRGVHSRAELNQLLARTPGERALFQQARRRPTTPYLPCRISLQALALGRAHAGLTLQQCTRAVSQGLTAHPAAARGAGRCFRAAQLAQRPGGAAQRAACVVSLLIGSTLPQTPAPAGPHCLVMLQNPAAAKP
jgi:hypothetical protein